MRWIEDDGRVTRVPHAVEQQQRQHVRLPGPADLLRAPDPPRRPLRARRLGHRASPTTINGKRLNSPNDVVAHPDGSSGSPIRPTAAQLYEGTPDAAGGPSNPPASSTRGSASPPSIGDSKRELPTNVYRCGPERPRRPRSSPRTRCPIRTACASRPTTRSSTSSAPARGRAIPDPAARATSTCSTSAPTTGSRTASCFSDFMVDGVKCGPDGVRVRRRRQPLVLEQRRPQRRLQRRHRVERRTASCIGRIRTARGLRQRLLRRPQAQPAVHGRQPVALRGLHRHAGRRASVRAARSTAAA